MNNVLFTDLPEKISVKEIYSLAKKHMKPEDIDHHGLGHGADDLYLKVTPFSRELVSRYEYPINVERFISNIEPHVPWYCIYFAYTEKEVVL